MEFSNFKDNWQRKKILESKKHQCKAFEEVNELIITERCGKKITLLDGNKLIEFISCSYLGLDQDKRLIKAASNNLYKCGVTFSSARTRVLFESFLILEELLNKIFYNAHCVIFSSVHLVNLGVFPLIASGEMPSFPFRDQGPFFIINKTAHASIQINRGLLKQFGEVTVINFDDLSNVEKQFRIASNTNRTPIAIADGVGSMGGLGSVLELLDLAEKYNGYIYLDDAHGISVYGKNGCGYVLSCLDTFHPRLILAASMAKAFGAVGGVVVLPTLEDAKMVKRFASTYIFGGPLPLAIVDSAIASANIHLSKEIYDLQEQLQKRILYFDKLMGIDFKSRIVNFAINFPIRGILMGDEFKAIKSTSKLRKKGFAVTAAMYPTVAKGRAMLRVNIAAKHTQKDIKSFCEALKEII